MDPRQCLGEKEICNCWSSVREFASNVDKLNESQRPKEIKFVVNNVAYTVTPASFLNISVHP
jgi:hypothetical protein